MIIFYLLKVHDFQCIKTYENGPYAKGQNATPKKNHQYQATKGIVALKGNEVWQKITPPAFQLVLRYKRAGGSYA